jgi:hypothetical protein
MIAALWIPATLAALVAILWGASWLERHVVVPGSAGPIRLVVAADHTNDAAPADADRPALGLGSPSV